MQTILKANSTISKLWTNKLNKDSSYRLFSYVITTFFDDKTLLYNSVTSELVLLNKEEQKKIDLLPSNYESWMDGLIEKHFIVNIDSDDKKIVDSLRNVFNTLDSSNKNISGYTILPTTYCNARCFYCYENTFNHEHMSDEVVEKTLKFIFEHRGNEMVNLNWFGGEPLIGLQQINKICSSLKEKEIPYKSKMISNGFLFDKEIVKTAKELWNLNSIQITLDGTEPVYNKTKNFITPSTSPYQRVIRNISLLLESGIHVDVRLNLGLHNFNDLVLLINQLAVSFKDKSNLMIYSHVLDYECGCHSIKLSEKENELLMNKEIEISDLITQLFPRLNDEQLPIFKTKACMMNNDASVIILPNGKLSRCEHKLNDLFMGDLDNGIDYEKTKPLKETLSCPKAFNCPLYPSCVLLKYCPVIKPCSLKEMNYKIEYCKRIIKNKYSEYLKNNKVE